MARNLKQETPPRFVVYAVWLYLISCGFLGVTRLVLFHDGATHILSVLFLSIVSGFFARSLYVGRKWVLWLNLAYGLIGVIASPWSLATLPKQPELSLYVVQALIFNISLIFLVLPSSRRWFRPNTSFNPDGLTPAGKFQR